MGSFAFEFMQTYASKYFPLAWQMMMGIVMLTIILFQPGGLWSIYQHILDRFKSDKKGADDV